MLDRMRDNEWTKVLGWPGYQVFRQEIDEKHKRMRLWVRRKRGNQRMVCSGCGRRVREIVEVYEREVRDLPCFEHATTVVIEMHRIRCPDCGVKVEKVDQLPSKAPFSKRFEEEVQGLRKRCRAPSGPSEGDGREHSAVNRSALPGALGSTATQEAIAADGSGRVVSGQTRQIPDSSEQSGDWRAAVVRQGSQERNAGYFFAAS